ncbi:tyrosine-type recombinase/integrase, partial [Nonomuraea sp. NPDC002799]
DRQCQQAHNGRGDTNLARNVLTQTWANQMPSKNAPRALAERARIRWLRAVAEIAQTAGLDDPATAHVLRHTLATTLVRGKTDLVLVAEILGHARLETIRRYSLPSDKDKEDALKLRRVL